MQLCSNIRENFENLTDLNHFIRNKWITLNIRSIKTHLKKKTMLFFYIFSATNTFCSVFAYFTIIIAHESLSLLTQNIFPMKQLNYVLSFVVWLLFKSATPTSTTFVCNLSSGFYIPIFHIRPWHRMNKEHILTH